MRGPSRDDPSRWLYAWGFASVAFGAASLLVPLYVVALGGDAFDLGVLAASAAAAGAPGAVLVGRFADRTGRRRGVVVLALAAVTAALAALPLLEWYPAVVAANAALWFAVAAVGPVLTMLVVGDTPEHDWPRHIARLNVYQGWGWAAGLVLGAAWTGVVGRLLGALSGQRTLFGICAVCGAAATVAAARWLPPETDRVSSLEGRRVSRLLARTQRSLRGLTVPLSPNRLYWSTRSLSPRRLARRFTPRLGVYFGATALFGAGFAAFWAPLPLFLALTGFDDGAVFALYLAASLGSAVLYGRAGVLSATHDVYLLQSGALGLRAVAFVVLAVAGAAYAASLVGLLTSVLLLVVVGLTWAVIAVTATTIVTRLAPPSLRGEALGVYAALSALAGGVGGLGGGALARVLGYGVAFAVAGALVVTGSALIFALRHPGLAAPRR